MGILAVCLEQWRTCSITPWVLHRIQWGYRLQFLSFQAPQALQVQNAYSASPVMPRDWFTTVNFVDAYFHITIHPGHRIFFFPSRGLHTGFGSCRSACHSPRIFTKCAEAILAPLRHQGMRVFWSRSYLDDVLLPEGSREQAVLQTQTLVSHLRALGCLINLKKCPLVPNQKISYLSLENRFGGQWIFADV